MALQEWGDKKWFPDWMRQHQMEFLAFMAGKLQLYKPILPVLQKLLALPQGREWTDTCSGEGGPVSYLAQALQVKQPVLLTDALLPAATTGTAYTTWHRAPVALPQDLPPGTGLITMFNAWHHFSPEDQQQILQQVAREGRPFLAAEILRPHLLSLLAVGAAATVGQLLFAPFIRPFRWSRLLFTYLLPVHIITVLYDGWISVLNSQSPRQLQDVLSKQTYKNYKFSFQQFNGTFSKVFCVVGMPQLAQAT